MSDASPEMLESLSPLVPALRRYARALLRERSAADDLVQECLERAIERWHQRRSGDPRAWLFAILHNLAISQLRQSGRRGLHMRLDDIGPGAPSQGATQEHSLQHTELLRALVELSEEHRSVLLLVSVEDLSYAEAAHVLDVPVGTVMSRLSRARSALCRLLDAGSRGRPVLRRLK